METTTPIQDTMTDYIEHRGVSRKTFLMYLLQFPLFGGIAKYVYGFKPQQRYLLNKFSIAGFCFYEGPNLLEEMKPGDTLTMKPEPENIEDEYAVELHFKGTIREIDPDAETWQMCKVKVEMVAQKIYNTLSKKI